MIFPPLIEGFSGTLNEGGFFPNNIMADWSEDHRLYD
jgi:hypothetical protein